MSESDTPVNEDWSQGWPGEQHIAAKIKLETNQHILHLFLTVVTGGLWIPVWIIRAIQGNKTRLAGPIRPTMPSSVYDPRFFPRKPPAGR